MARARTALATVATLLGLGVSAGPAFAGEVVVSPFPLSAPGTVDAYGGRVVWSTGTPGDYGLFEYAQAKAQQLPVPGRRSPFDVDLGPARGGGTVAVYSRCQNDPERSDLELDGTRGCDLYIYDFARRAERPLGRANSTADEYFAAVWKNRIAFTRTYTPRGFRIRRRLYWRPLTGRGPSRRVRLGSRIFGGIPREIDMRGDRVAFVLDHEYGAEIRLTSTRGRTRQIASLPGSGAAAQEYRAVGPSVVRRYVYWGLNQFGDPPVFSEVRRKEVSTGSEQLGAHFADRSIVALSQDAGESFEIRSSGGCAPVFCPPVGPFDIWRVTGRVFGPAPPLELHAHRVTR
jgi:hypothetical protein